MVFDGNFTRFELDGTVDHKDGQQFVDGQGYGSERFKRVHRLESHGFSSWPIKGGLAALMTQRDNRESAYIFGGENPSLRPKGEYLTQGGTAIYDHAGNIVSIVGAKLRIVHATEIYMEAPTIVLNGLVKLGGEDADRPAAALGSIDTDGDSEVGNLATKVLVK